MSHRLNNLSTGDSILVAWTDADELLTERFVIEEIQPMYGGFAVESIDAMEQQLDLGTAELTFGTRDFQISNDNRTVWINEGLPNTHTYFLVDTADADLRYEAGPCYRTLGVAETHVGLAWEATLTLIQFGYDPAVAIDFSARHLANIPESRYAMIRDLSPETVESRTNPVLADERL